MAKQKKNVFVVVHGIGDQQRGSTARQVALRLGSSDKYFSGNPPYLPLQPLGYYHRPKPELIPEKDRDEEPPSDIEEFFSLEKTDGRYLGYSALERWAVATAVHQSAARDKLRLHPRKRTYQAIETHSAFCIGLSRASRAQSRLRAPETALA